MVAKVTASELCLSTLIEYDGTFPSFIAARRVALPASERHEPGAFERFPIRGARHKILSLASRERGTSNSDIGSQFAAVATTPCCVSRPSSSSPDLRRALVCYRRTRTGGRRLMSPPAPQKSLSGVITSEDELVEKPGLELLVELGWTHVDLFNEEPGPANPTGRLSFRELCCPRASAPRSASSTRHCRTKHCSRPRLRSLPTAPRCCRWRRTARSTGCCATASRCRCDSPMARSSTSASPSSTGRTLQPTTSSSPRRSGSRAASTSAGRTRSASSTASRCC